MILEYMIPKINSKLRYNILVVWGELFKNRDMRY
jgi:hypothetical protein